MSTKMTYFWLIYSCLIFGSGVLCDKKLERRQAVSSCFVNAKDNFNCTNGESIESSRVCDGRKDCPDGSDETNELCTRNDYGTNMTTDCGKVYANQVLTNDSQTAFFGVAPWNVVVYRFNKRKFNYELICGGSIISSNLVVSAAHCFWKNGMSSNRILINDSLYKIAVGKYDKNITIIDSNFTQIIDVEMLYVAEGYYGFGAFLAEDIAIIVLKDRVSFNNIVAPICIDWNDKYNEVNGDQGKIVGWGHTSDHGILNPILLESSLAYIDRRSCRNIYTNGFESYVTFDKFCAGSALVSEQGMGRGSAGAGLSFFHNNSYYLTGVMSAKDPETNNSIAVFTDVKHHIQWIRVLYNRYRRRAVPSCSVNTEDKFNCSNGLSIEKSWVCDGLKDCSDGSDETNELCARNENGTNMNSDCGKVYINQVLINNGQKALFETAAWNVGVYQFNKRNSSNYDLICGGSIISSNLVVSAAHCFWKNGMSSNRILINDSLYKIAVGKYDRNITIIDSNFTQIMDVEIVYMNEGYYGISGHYAEDIAIIVLKDRVSFSNIVSPVCIDWNGKYDEVNRDQGKIVGWERTSDHGILNPILLESSLAYIDRKSCRNIYTNGFESYVTFDKFCAGSALGQEVGVGYAGAGLSFFHNNSYYLTGVMSVKDPETNNSIVAFTEVKLHIKWIRELYNKHN